MLGPLKFIVARAQKAAEDFRVGVGAAVALSLSELIM